MAEPSVGPAGPDDPGGPLAGRLEGALHRRLDQTPVDVAGLLAGSHRRARRVRTTRAAVAGAAVVLAIAVPVGHELLLAGPGTTVTPAAMMPSTSHTDRGDRTAFQDRTSRSARTAREIPGSVSFTPSELPSGAVPTDAGFVVAPSTPDDEMEWFVMRGVKCAIEPGHGSVTMRRWTWELPGKGNYVRLTVNRGSERGATRALDMAGRGECQGQSGDTTAGPVTFGDQATLFVDASGGDSQVLFRVGGEVACVDVSGPDAKSLALQLAGPLEERLAALAAGS